MKVFITGGCGFIGTNFIKIIMEERPDWEVINFDALTYAGIRENLTQYEDSNRYQFVQGDIADRAAVEAAMDDSVDGVIHFAAESFVDRSIVDATPFVQSNVLGTQVMLDVARSRKVDRFLHVSTDEVYGSLGDEGFFTEETPIDPRSPYSASKAGGDLLVLAAYETHGDPVVITRCSNNYGPYQFPEKLIPLMVIKATAKESLPVYGDGMNVRDWIHVEDHARGVLASFEKGRDGEVYNFGARNEWANINLVKEILKIVERGEDLITYVTDRPGHDRRYAIDPIKAETELEWKPRYNFEDGLQQTVEWYQQNTEWWMPLLSGDFKQFAEKWYANRT